MKAFNKISLKIAISLFALSGLFFFISIVTNIAWYGTNAVYQNSFQDDLDSGLRQFSENFSHMELSRHGLIFADNKKDTIKYADKTYFVSPGNIRNLIINADNTDIYFIESYTDNVVVTFTGILGYKMNNKGESTFIEPEEFDVTVLGEKPSITIELPLKWQFDTLKVTSYSGNIDAETLIADSIFLTVNQGNVSISEALVSGSETHIEAENGHCYVNCIDTEKLWLFSRYAKVDAGLTDSLTKATVISNFSRLNLLAGKNIVSSAFDVNSNLSDIRITYE